MSSNKSSDPLPYTQLDRAVKPKAAILANALGVTNQHALGSLAEFWELCGDPRELERIIAATPEGMEPEVVLNHEDLELRFHMASGKVADAKLLVALGLVEPRENGYRVRGMSRYFAPLKRRVHARKIAVAGGVARAGAPRENGRFVAAGAQAEPLAEVTSAPQQPEISQPSSPAPACDQPTTSLRSSTAYSVQRSSSKDLAAESAASASEKQRVNDRLLALSLVLIYDFEAVRHAQYLHGGAKDTEGLKRVMKVATDEEIRARWKTGLKANGYRETNSFAQLAAKWNDLGVTSKPRRDEEEGVWEKFT